jgi:hypothetical protein
MAQDFRSTLKTKYEVDLSGILQGRCTLCVTPGEEFSLEIYRHREIPAIFALFCPKCGGLFQVVLNAESLAKTAPQES